jgi:O-Antigen ligase
MFGRAEPGIEPIRPPLPDGRRPGRSLLGERLPAGALGSLAIAALLVLVGAATAVDPRLGALIAVVCVAAWLAADSTRASSVFLFGLVVILVGYATLDRGFAHLGLNPIYVGEVVLGVGVVAIIARADRLRLRTIPVLLAAFIAWGVIRTIPYLSTYGVDALRDGVTYGYGLIAFAVLVCVGEEQLPKIIGFFARLVPLLLVWIPLGLLVSEFAPNAIPSLPGSDVSLLLYKPGDAAVHLAGIASFLLLGLDGGRRAGSAIREVGTWALLLIGTAVAAILNRGGMLALASVASVLLFTRSARRWASLTLTVGAILSVLLVANPEIRIGAGTRTISLSQAIDNVTSVVFASQDAALQGTKDFRLNWWGRIIDYTIGGPYFWTGKGFGINLADDDGFQPTADHSLRAPHNAHVEILARMGVPGLVLWVLLQVAFGAALLRAGLAAGRAGAAEWTARFAWVFVYWLAMIVNMSFDPYLEGPQGGIWFWAIFGFGLVLLEAWRRTEADAGARMRAIAPVHG